MSAAADAGEASTVHENAVDRGGLVEVSGGPGESGAPQRGTVLPSNRWAVVLATVGALLVVAFVAFAILTALPPTAANLASSTSDGVTPVELTTSGVTADVIVPAGWVVVGDGDGAFLALTPDGVMKVRVALTPGAADEIVERTAGRASDLRTETLASGLAVVHADLEDGGLAAGVDVPGAVVVLRSELLQDVDPATFRPAFAELLEGVQP